MLPPRWSALAVALAFGWLLDPGASHATPIVVVARTVPGARLGGASVRPAAPSIAALIARPGLPALALRGTLAGRLPPWAGRSGDLPFDPERVWVLDAPDSASALAASRALAADPGVLLAEPVRTRHICATFPDDPLFLRGQQWGLYNVGLTAGVGGVSGADIHALAAWARSVGSNDLLLAVADTGIDPDQPDLAGTLPDGRPRIVNGFDVAFGDPVEAWADSFGHGTPVAGVMAARTNNGAWQDSLGIAGVCGGNGVDNAGCQIMPIKITAGSTGYATDLSIAAALIIATDSGARAINISFAGPDPSALERVALMYASTHGCMPVCAAGNRGAVFPRQPQYPAAYAADGVCIQVGASDEFDRRVAFSSYGPGLDVLAPGVDIWTTFMTYPSAAGASYPGYLVDAGTSFAAPFVTGTVGLLAARRPDLTDDDAQHVIRLAAHDLATPGWDAETGWGRLDAAAALALVDSTMVLWHGDVAGQTVVPAEIDTLRADDEGDFTDAQVLGPARRFEAHAIVTLPDSLLGTPMVWTRLAGTTTSQGGFHIAYRIPAAEVTLLDRNHVDVHGSVYLLQPDCFDCDSLFAPIPPAAAHFAYTVLARVDRPPQLAVAGPAPGAMLVRGDSVSVSWRATDPDEVSRVQVWIDQGATSVLVGDVPGTVASVRPVVPCVFDPGPATLRVVALDQHGPHLDNTVVREAVTVEPGACDGPRRLAAAPNPFGETTTFSGPPGAMVTVFDVAGRAVRRVRLDGSSGRALWAGHDDDGRPLAPGLYLARLLPGDGRVVRVVRTR